LFSAESSLKIAQFLPKLPESLARLVEHPGSWSLNCETPCDNKEISSWRRWPAFGFSSGKGKTDSSKATSQ
jgi:hypothetical protein